jgi:hypothetical protein
MIANPVRIASKAEGTYRHLDGCRGVEFRCCILRREVRSQNISNFSHHAKYFVKCATRDQASASRLLKWRLPEKA